MSLPDRLKAGWIAPHKTNRQEIADLLGIADRDLADCRAKGLSADWRLNIAYNAALQAATAALAACGFRSARDSHHFRIIHSMTLTIGLSDTVVQQLEQFRKKRNIGGYQRAGTISDHEAGEMIQLAEEVCDGSSLAENGASDVHAVNCRRR